jgi:hypothetical protein
MLAPAAVVEEVEQRKLVLVPIRDAPMRRTVYFVRNPLRMVTRAALEIERLTLELTLSLVRKGVWRGEVVMPDKRSMMRGRQANVI